MKITARVRQSYHPHQSTEQAKLARHIVLDVPLDGRLRREAGDALCRPAYEFYELERGDVEGEATCKKCIERAARYGVLVITAAAVQPAETVEAERAEQAPTVHHFRSTGEAYDASQCRDDIADGDVLVIEREQVVGFLRRAWPGAITAAHGELATFTADPRTIDDGRYAASVDLAEQIARDLGALLAGEQRVVEGVVVEHAGTAKGSTPSNATHPNVVAARVALGTLKPAALTDHHDVMEPTEAERDVRGYLIAPREGRRVAVYWLEGGRVVQHDDGWHGPALDCLAYSLNRAGWAVEKMLRSSLCVFAHRPVDDVESAPAATEEAKQEAAFELAGAVEAVVEAEVADGTWRGRWIASTPRPTGDALFDLDEGAGEQGALFE